MSQENTTAEEFFESAPVSLEDAVALIATHPLQLTEAQARRLLRVASKIVNEDDEYGANFDIKDEITHQIRSVRAMREQVLDEEGKIRQDIHPREVKEVVTASTTLLKTLISVHDQVMNYDRMKAVEDATVMAIRTLGKDAQDAFFTDLQQRLKSIE